MMIESKWLKWNLCHAGYPCFICFGFHFVLLFQRHIVLQRHPSFDTSPASPPANFAILPPSHSTTVHKSIMPKAQPAHSMNPMCPHRIPYLRILIVFSTALYHTLESFGMLFPWASLSSPLDYKLPKERNWGCVVPCFISGSQHPVWCCCMIRGQGKRQGWGCWVPHFCSHFSAMAPIGAFCKDSFQWAPLSYNSSPPAHWKLCCFQHLCNSFPQSPRLYPAEISWCTTCMIQGYGVWAPYF